jgi:hypothetical protein
MPRSAPRPRRPEHDDGGWLSAKASAEPAAGLAWRDMLPSGDIAVREPPSPAQNQPASAAMRTASTRLRASSLVTAAAR